jgi:ethanolamine ammonia-lyase small subunit
LRLREDHAAARDAIQAEIDLERDLGKEFMSRWNLFEVATLAATKDQYLLRPDLGRSLTTTSRERLRQLCPRAVHVQPIIGDGLSVAAISEQVPRLLPLLMDELQRHGLTTGQPFAVRHCRVGVLNEIGDILDPDVAVLLIGERPGLATAESLSAYLAYRPRPGDTDAQRNLISNIHARGIPVVLAVPRIVALCRKLLQLRQSGFVVKEDPLPTVTNE